METGWILPDTNEPTSAPFWAGTARGELLVQQCSACREWRMPPRPMCPRCRSIEVTWVPTSGTGKVWSFVIPHPPLLPAFGALAPYNAVIVELDEDPQIRFAGNVVESAEGEINETDPHSIKIGEPVQVVFHQIEDVFLPRWVRR
jgi:uncharacterized OB-fold protein